MTDDIVTRLRTTLAHADDVYDTMDQAADEIERLRAEVLKLGRAYGKAVDYIGRIGDE